MTICYAWCFHSSSVLQSVARSSSDTLPGWIGLSLRSAGHHKPPWTNQTGTRRFPRCSRASLKKRMDPHQLDLGDISYVLLNTHLSHGRASSAPPGRGRAFGHGLDFCVPRSRCSNTLGIWNLAERGRCSFCPRDCSQQRNVALKCRLSSNPISSHRVCPANMSFDGLIVVLRTESIDLGWGICY